uniref:Retrovirus-related Pol polyprotein from transposon TNT 1-94 n=1 Tax=Tanacetum cinerariifolium TaxID=118510 RepID=A0A6L2JTR2_TANCI|nr:retrovirus-related Pol polyprotein from transposon TNT 1-94 [Tanacetum cinerariifolium]
MTKQSMYSPFGKMWYLADKDGFEEKYMIKSKVFNLLKIDLDIFFYDTSFGMIFDEFKRLSNMEDDLFTYELEVVEDFYFLSLILIFKKRLLRLIDVIVEQLLDLKIGDHKKVGKEIKEEVYTKNASLIYWIRGDDEEVLTDEELYDRKEEKVSEEKEIVEIFRIETDIFDFKTPLWMTNDDAIQGDHEWFDEHKPMEDDDDIDDLDDYLIMNYASYFVDEEKERSKERRCKLLGIPYVKPLACKYEKFKDHRQKEGIDYDEVFAPVARIEAIRLFLDYASFMDFTVYQMDVKSAFLYGTIEEKVYVSQPTGFVDQQFPDKVYKVEKALYGLYQAPRAWYETLSNCLLENGFRRGTIDKILFIKKIKNDILLVQVYVDDIIFGSTKRSLSTEFEQLMHNRFQMSSMGELTFFLGMQVKQRKDGIFLSQDKYVCDIIKKFSFSSVKSASTPMETHKPLSKDSDATDVDVHLYLSMIGSLMYLTSSRLDIMFAVCACLRFQVQPKVSYMHVVKRIFRYLNGYPTLGFWYPKDSPLKLIAYSDSDYAESLVRSDLLFDDEDGISCLTNDEIFKNLALMGYEPLSTKLTFQKDEAVNSEEGDSVERGITIDASLEAAQDSDNITNTQTMAIPNVDIPRGIDTGGRPRRQETIRGTSAQTWSERVLEQPKEPPLTEGPTSRSGDGRLEENIKLTDTIPTPHDLPLTGGYTLGSDDGRITLAELMETCTILSNRVTQLETNLSTTKDVYNNSFITLTNRVKKLESQLKQKRSRAVIHSSDEKWTKCAH